MQIGAVDAGGRVGQVVQHCGVGMPEGVVAPDADERELRADGVEEPGCVRVPAVMGDLEHVGAQRVRVLQEQRLREDLGVSGEQHAAVGVVEAQHERDLVEVGADRPVARW